MLAESYTIESDLLSTVYKQYHDIAKNITGEEIIPKHLIEKYVHTLDENLDVHEVVEELKEAVTDTVVSYRGSELDLMCTLHEYVCETCLLNEDCDDYVEKLNYYSNDLGTMTLQAKAIMWRLIHYVGRTANKPIDAIFTGDSCTHT